MPKDNHQGKQSNRSNLDQPNRNLAASTGVLLNRFRFVEIRVANRDGILVMLEETRDQPQQTLKLALASPNAAVVSVFLELRQGEKIVLPFQSVPGTGGVGMTISEVTLDKPIYTNSIAYAADRADLDANDSRNTKDGEIGGRFAQSVHDFEPVVVSRLEYIVK